MNHSATPNVVSDQRFSVEDFHRRWLAARMSSLTEVVEYSQTSEADEIALVARVRECDRDRVLKTVFDRSRALGLSVVRYLNMTWELSDIQDVLQHSPSACLRGHWSRTLSATVLKRPGCDDVKSVGSFVCDYWREALDGFVMGVGEQERFARHASVGHGDAQCLDVFFDDSLDAAGNKPRHAEVPEKLRTGLHELTQHLAQQKVTLTLDGVSEGILYYKMESADGPLCGAGGKMLHEALAIEVARKFPGLAMRDASPLAVYGEGTK